MTPQTQDEHVMQLELSRDEFLNAVQGVSESDAKIPPPSGGWSVLDCVEHVIVAEGRFLGWLETAAAEGAPPRNEGKEAQLVARMGNREGKRPAPDAVLPTGRFASLAEAVDQFRATRRRSIEFAGARGPGLYSLVVQHHFFGTLNGGEVAVLIANHGRRHAEQIKEVRAAIRA